LYPRSQPLSSALSAQELGQSSLDLGVVQEIFEHAKPLGHHEKASNLNLGFGFFYYGLARALRPKHTLVIGSGHGFSVICLALGLKDNRRGRLTFVDPSYSLSQHGPFKTIGGQDNWSDPEAVRSRFARFGLEDIVQHFKMTSMEFFAAYKDLKLPKIQLAFIDGNHSYKNVREDFLGVHRNSTKNAYVLLHDTNIFIREMLNHSGVKRWLKHLRDHPKRFEVVDFPFSSGVALARIRDNTPWRPEQ